MIKQPEKRDPNYRQIGRVLRPHGVLGELRIEVFTEETELFDRETLLLGKRVEQLASYEVQALRGHQGKILLKLAGVDDRETADTFRAWEVYVPRTQLPPLAQGEFYLYELLGMRVVTDTGELLGKVTDVLRTGANEVFVVTTAAQKEILIPDVEEVVLAVKRDEQEIIVHLLEGLV